jgi:preprotein translocase subunit SecE
MAEVKKENWFKRTWGKVCRFFRELRSELKKISWPTPKQVAKNTLIVVVCVAVLGVIIFVFDKVANLGLDALLMIKP